jgi:3-oxoacyl-[acyl-carrier protein] reductase
MTQAVEGGPATLEGGGREVPAGIPARSVRMIEAGIPLGRGGTPEEAAGGVFLLCSPEPDYIRGQVLMVTGGL